MYGGKPKSIKVTFKNIDNSLPIPGLKVTGVWLSEPHITDESGSADLDTDLLPSGAYSADIDVEDIFDGPGSLEDFSSSKHDISVQNETQEIFLKAAIK